ncbi:hypothetical protein [Sediminibacillus albus]|uniref:Uncharacterized protein n=1 Tax=Sediminibacillus albus TaxID=407036 RepID=A0A1G8ZVS1_9BACI|nr:hypothetical protein [Sediminibacillus albus]SDK18455.1 hypothetical protein SAMN05216243_2220 [Sediminibacillus albus]
MKKLLIVLFLMLIISFGVVGYVQTVSPENEVDLEADKGTQLVN